MGNNDGVGGRNLYGPGKQVAGYEINTDALPDDDIASINSRNRAFWGQGNGTTAGGGKLTPAPGGGRESKSGSFMPNQAGGINQARRTSTGQQRLDPGKTSANNLKAFGTEDAVMAKVIRQEDHAMANKNLMRRTNHQIGHMQAANERLR